MTILVIQGGLNRGIHHMTSIWGNDGESCGRLTFSLILQNSDDHNRRLYKDLNIFLFDDRGHNSSRVNLLWQVLEKYKKFDLSNLNK